MPNGERWLVSIAHFEARGYLEDVRDVYVGTRHKAVPQFMCDRAYKVADFSSGVRCCLLVPQNTCAPCWLREQDPTAKSAFGLPARKFARGRNDDAIAAPSVAGALKVHHHRSGGGGGGGGRVVRPRHDSPSHSPGMTLRHYFKCIGNAPAHTTDVSCRDKTT